MDERSRSFLLPARESARIRDAHASFVPRDQVDTLNLMRSRRAWARKAVGERNMDRCFQQERKREMLPSSEPGSWVQGRDPIERKRDIFRIRIHAYVLERINHRRWRGCRSFSSRPVQSKVLMYKERTSQRDGLFHEVETTENKDDVKPQVPPSKPAMEKTRGRSTEMRSLQGRTNSSISLERIVSSVLERYWISFGHFQRQKSSLTSRAFKRETSERRQADYEHIRFRVDLRFHRWKTICTIVSNEPRLVTEEGMDPVF